MRCFSQWYAVPLTVAVVVAVPFLSPDWPNVGVSCCTKFAPSSCAWFRKSFIA